MDNDSDKSETKTLKDISTQPRNRSQFWPKKTKCAILYSFFQFGIQIIGI